MSRDNSIYFMNHEFPHEAWAAILSVFGAESRPLDGLDKKLGVTHNWSFDGVDGGVHLDLKRVDPGHHVAPPCSNWSIGVHCNGHRGVQHWFLYVIPIHAIARFDHTIFFDPHAPRHAAACDIAGVEKRMRSILTPRCNSEDLIANGLTTHGDPYWPRSLDRSVEAAATVATQESMLDFCEEHDVQCMTDCTRSQF